MKRKDATLIKEVDSFHSIVPYVMPKRTEAEVSFTDVFDVTALKKYMDKRNKKKDVNIKIFHAICTAVAKVIYLRPKLNIFIAGKKFWQRNDITLSFVVKQKFEDEAEEALMFLKVQEDMNIDKISDIILGKVERVRKDGTNSLDKTMDFVGKLPRPILNVLFFVIRRLEYHGIMPRALQKGDPNYSTCLLSNLGSIGCDSCNHHLNDYGTNSFMMTIGEMKQDEATGKWKIQITVNLDERIADGFYFAKSLKLMRFLLSNPKYLEEKISDPVPYEI